MYKVFEQPWIFVFFVANLIVLKGAYRTVNVLPLSVFLRNCWSRIDQGGSDIMNGVSSFDRPKSKQTDRRW